MYTSLFFYRKSHLVLKINDVGVWILFVSFQALFFFLFFCVKHLLTEYSKSHTSIFNNCNTL